MGADRAYRRTLLVTTAALVALGAVGTAVAVSVDGDRVSPAASPTPGAATPSPSPGPGAPSPAPTAEAPEPEHEIAVRDVEPALAGYLQQVDLLSAETDLDELAGVVTGAALSELEAQQLELDANGWTITGTTSVDGVRVVAADPAGTPPSATVEACIDSSTVTLLDSDGDPVAVDPESTRRALNVYRLELTDGTWRVVSHTFPDDPQC